MTNKRLAIGAAVVAAAATVSLAIPVHGRATHAAKLAAMPAKASRTASTRRPNILFILIDDAGYGDFSITGNTVVTTPNIDRLAHEGLLMTQFDVAGPICSASREGFMTGRFPARDKFITFIDNRKHNAATGQADWLPLSIPTLPEALKPLGYATGHFGKWHLGGGRDVGEAPLPTQYGFDESYVQFEGMGPRVIPTDHNDALGQQSAALGRGPVDRLPKAALTERFIDKALAFIVRQKAKPWFVEVWPDDVHEDWFPDETQAAAVKNKGRNERENRFFAALVGLDKEVGRLIDTLRATGQLDNTLVVLTSDNGPTAHPDYYQKDGFAAGSAGIFRGRKNSLYEGGIREPLIVRWPGHVAANTRDTTTVAMGIDLFPTLAAVTGAQLPGQQDGISLLPAWTGHPIAKRPDLFWTYGGYGPYEAWPRPGLKRDNSPSFAIRSGDWKLLAEGDGSHAELYDLVRDPSESHDQAAQQPALVRTLSARLVAWQKSLPLRPSYAKPVPPKTGGGV